MAIHQNLSLHFHSMLLKLQSSTSFLNVTTIIALCVFFSLLCACIIIGHLLHGNRWANQSISALSLGLLSGGVVLLLSNGKSSHLLSFSEDLFFLYLLPPIIFNAGFQVKKKQFFKNFTIILLFGVLGTVISFCIISLGVFYLFKKLGVTALGVQDYLALGAILSATDTVCTLQVLSQEETPFLYSAVFGEGVVNDATSIVLFNAVQSLDFRKISGITALELLGTFLYLFTTSTLLGVAAGLLSAYIIKTLYFGRHSTDREVALMLLMAYLSYMLAELLDLSGIMTIFFCGIVMSHYTWHNITESSRITTKHAFATLSFVAENFIFLYVGMDALDVTKWKNTRSSILKSASVSATLLALVLFGRAAFIFPLTNIRNFLKRKSTDKIEFRQQFIMWWAGLMRGAVTIALSYSEFSKSKTTSSEDSALTFTCVIIIVLFSTTVFGLVTKPLIEAVLLRYPRRAVSDATDIPSLEDLGLLFLESGDTSHEGNNQQRRNSLSLLIKYPTSSVHYLWRKFDDRFMRPVFGGRGFAPYAPGSPPEVADEDQETH